VKLLTSNKDCITNQDLSTHQTYNASTSIEQMSVSKALITKRRNKHKNRCITQKLRSRVKNFKSSKQVLIVFNELDIRLSLRVQECQRHPKPFWEPDVGASVSFTYTWFHVNSIQSQDGRRQFKRIWKLRYY